MFSKSCLLQRRQKASIWGKGLKPNQSINHIYKKDVIILHREGNEPKDTHQDQVRYAQRLYLSAFHPDTGELQNVIGRMSFYVPGGMVLIGAMITFYK